MNDETTTTTDAAAAAGQDQAPATTASDTGGAATVDAGTSTTADAPEAAVDTAQTDGGLASGPDTTTVLDPSDPTTTAAIAAATVNAIVPEAAPEQAAATDQAADQVLVADGSTATAPRSIAHALAARIVGVRDDLEALPGHVAEEVRDAVRSKLEMVETEVGDAFDRLHELGLRGILDMAEHDFHAIFGALVRHSHPAPPAAG